MTQIWFLMVETLILLYIVFVLRYDPKKKSRVPFQYKDVLPVQEFPL